eukprot:s48_g47.t2
MWSPFRKVFLFQPKDVFTRSPLKAFRWSGGMLDTFSNWMDRVLALLMEVPGSLMFQRSLLQATVVVTPWH